MKTTEDRYVYRCTTCGGTQVEGTAWIDLNTGMVSDSEPPTDDCWCHDCQDHTGIDCVKAGSREEAELLAEIQQYGTRRDRWTTGGLRATTRRTEP